MGFKRPEVRIFSPRRRKPCGSTSTRFFLVFGKVPKNTQKCHQKPAYYRPTTEQKIAIKRTVFKISKHIQSSQPIRNKKIRTVHKPAPSGANNHQINIQFSILSRYGSSYPIARCKSPTPAVVGSTTIPRITTAMRRQSSNSNEKEPENRPLAPHDVSRMVLRRRNSANMAPQASPTGNAAVRPVSPNSLSSRNIIGI